MQINRWSPNANKRAESECKLVGGVWKKHALFTVLLPLLPLHLPRRARRCQTKPHPTPSSAWNILAGGRLHPCSPYKACPRLRTSRKMFPSSRGSGLACAPPCVGGLTGAPLLPEEHRRSWRWSRRRACPCDARDPEATGVSRPNCTCWSRACLTATPVTPREVKGQRPRRSPPHTGHAPAGEPDTPECAGDPAGNEGTRTDLRGDHRCVRITATNQYFNQACLLFLLENKIHLQEKQHSKTIYFEHVFPHIVFSFLF